jgi:hypothetical protein
VGVALLVAILISGYVIPLLVIIAAASALYWALVWFLFAGRTTALVVSAAVGLLSVPMLVGSHGVALVPLALGILTSKSMFSIWSLAVAPISGWLTYWVLGRIWVATVYEPASSGDKEKVRPWET